MSSEKEQHLDEEFPQPSATRARRRPCRRPPPDDVIRNSIAKSLTQILVNMRNAEWQQKCRELLQVDDLIHGAHLRILAHLEHIDAQREQREREAKERRERKANAGGKKTVS